VISSKQREKKLFDAKNFCFNVCGFMEKRGRWGKVSIEQRALDTNAGKKQS
jgi:hypothetical protein